MSRAKAGWEEIKNTATHAPYLNQIELGGIVVSSHGRFPQHLGESKEG